MPTVAYFYGIAVSMYFNDHAPPHFHVQYQGWKASVRIADGVVIAGSLPPTAARIVRHWARARTDELDANWARGRKDEPFERIAGPDDPGA